MVLLSETKNIDIPNDMRGSLVEVFYLIFTGMKYRNAKNAVVEKFEEYLRTGESESILKLAEKKCNETYESDNEIEAFFCGCIMRSHKNSNSTFG